MFNKLLLFVVFFHSFGYAHQCIPPKDDSSSPVIFKAKPLGGINSYFVAKKHRAYIYSYPDVACRQKNLFIIDGDLVYGYAHYSDFYYMEYITRKGDSIYGWVNKSDLEPLHMVEIRGRPEISIADFAIHNSKQWIAINFALDSLSKIGHNNASSFIGDFPNQAGGLYKYYSYSYSFGDIVVSNVLYDKRMHDIDDGYRIQSIHLTNKEYLTARGLTVGDSIEDVINSYKPIDPFGNDSSLIYKLGNYSIEYRITNGRISTIDISLEIPSADLSARISSRQ